MELNDKFVCNMIQQKCATVKMKSENQGENKLITMEPLKRNWINTKVLRNMNSINERK